MTDTSITLLSAREVRKRIGGVSNMTLWRRLGDESLGFPKPSLVRGRRYWVERELNKWLEQQLGT